MAMVSQVHRQLNEQRAESDTETSVHWLQTEWYRQTETAWEIQCDQHRRHTDAACERGSVMGFKLAAEHFMRVYVLQGSQWWQRTPLCKYPI